MSEQGSERSERGSLIAVPKIASTGAESTISVAEIASAGAETASVGAETARAGAGIARTGALGPSPGGMARCVDRHRGLEADAEGVEGAIRPPAGGGEAL